MNPEDFAKWIETVRWQVAKTMPEIPHEYTIAAWHDQEAFFQAARFIRKNGYRAKWQHHRPKPYYEPGDGRLYWAFQFVINRALLSDPVSGAVERID